MAHSTRSESNDFLINIADVITEEELEEMINLCDGNHYLPRGKLVAIKNPREFLSFLHQHGTICPEDLSYFVWLLRGVGCFHLAASIEKQGKILVKTHVHIDFLRLNEAFTVFPL